MIEQLGSAAEKKLFTDVEFQVDEKKFAAHKFLIAARSPALAEMMANLDEGGVIAVEDCDPAVFQNFLYFLYTGQVKAGASRRELFALAEKYQVETLKFVCQDSDGEVDVSELTALIVSLSPWDTWNC